MNPKILFRADGNSKIGLGHIMRCISLIDMLPKKIDKYFVTNCKDEEINKFISSKAKLVKLDSQTSNDFFSIINKNDIVVLDGYDFNIDYQKKIKILCKKLIYIDDIGDNMYFSDIIINHGATEELPKYPDSKNVKILRGFDYLILRKEFLECTKKKRIINKIDSVFICMGGSDPQNLTLKILKICKKISFLHKINIVTASTNPFINELIEEISSTDSSKKINIYKNADSNIIIKIIKSCQIAITTASTISLEVCCVKAGLITGVIVKNQLLLNKKLLKNKCCLSVGDWTKVNEKLITDKIKLLSNPSSIKKMIDYQRINFDGSSNERLAKIFKNLIYEN